MCEVMNKNVLIIGYGSIGKRHADILTDLGCRVSILSKREINVKRSFFQISDAIKEENPDYIVIANNTVEHYSTLMELKKIGFKGQILIEKPLFHNKMDIPTDNYNNVYVAYNMRFNPLLQRLKRELMGQKVISAQAYVGQYLPQWRPNQDYRRFYSAHKSEGGGVLRDLSHELDYVNWLLGSWKSVSAIGGQYSDLEIDSDDVFSLMLEMENCPIVTIQLNYLDRVAHRNLLINTNQHVFQLDFINKTFQKDSEVCSIDIERNYSYLMEHKAILNGEFDDLCTIMDGSEVLNLIHAAEESAYSKNKYRVFNEKNM